MTMEATLDRTLPAAQTRAPAAETTVEPVKILVYRWAGKWGPFKVNIPCGECTLTGDIIRDTIDNELAGIPVTFETRDWLSNWWQPLWKGGWHAPIVLVDGKIIAQGAALNRGVLAEQVVKAWVGRAPIVGNHLFGKDNCGHCDRAKARLKERGISFVHQIGRAHV